MKSPIGLRVEKRSKRKVFDLKDMLIGMGLLIINFLSNEPNVGHLFFFKRDIPLN